MVCGAICACILLTTCGGHKHAANPPSIRSGGFQAAEGVGSLEAAPPTIMLHQTLDEALVELEGMECPEGVDAALWAELKDALADALFCRARTCGAPLGDYAKMVDGGAQVPALQGETRFVCTPPTGEANRVNDLTISDNGDGTYTLSWHYRNLGDYDQNGAVGIEDITPLAMHYSETYELIDENCLLAVIDGSGNGRIGIEEITPIAMNFAASVDHYAVEGAPDEAGSYELVSEIAQDAGIGEGRLEYSAVIESPAALWHRVVPVDSEGAPGEPSNAVLRPSREPIIYQVSPTEGYQHEEYTFSATFSGVEPLTYAWDFGGGAEPDTSSDPSPTVTLADAGEYEASLTVTNAYGEASFPFALTVSERDIWAHTWGGEEAEWTKDMVVDEDGNAYVFGFTSSFGQGHTDVLLVKFDAGGNVSWARTWGGEGAESPIAATMSNEGTLLLSGYTEGYGEGRDDILLMEYSPQGELIRALTWGTSHYESGLDIAVDGEGNAYICGKWVVYGGDPLALIVKLDPEWNVLWAKLWGGTWEDPASDVLAYGGAVYVCGRTASFEAHDGDAFLMKMSEDGEVLWARTWGTEREDSAYEMTIGPDGCIYLVGRSKSVDPEESAGFILKYDADGDFLSARSREVSPWDNFRDVCFDPEGNLVVIGKAEGNIALIVFNPDLNVMICREWRGSYIRSEGRSCGFDAEGYLYIAGESRNPVGNWSQVAPDDFFPEGVETAVEGDVWDLEGVAHTPEGTVTAPEGLLDTATGSEDLLIIKYYPK